MAGRTRRAAAEQPVEAAAPDGLEQAAGPAEQPAEQPAKPTATGLLRELDVEAWVAAVYDHQHNGGPYPERTYRTPAAEPVHVDALGHVTAVDRTADDEQTEG